MLCAASGASRSRKRECSSEKSIPGSPRALVRGFISARSFAGDEIQKRSYPNSFGGQHTLEGYEMVERLDIAKHAPRIAEEAAALHTAAQCPEQVGTLILGSSQLGLQIHESVGHPIEL